MDIYRKREKEVQRPGPGDSETPFAMWKIYIAREFARFFDNECLSVTRDSGKQKTPSQPVALQQRAGF